MKGTANPTNHRKHSWLQGPKSFEALDFYLLQTNIR
jgi:hypothetical protein